MESVAQINPYEKMFSWNQPPLSRRKSNRKRSVNPRSSGRFYALTKLADDTHHRLVENGSPLRLCVYKDEEDLFMDVIAIDKTEKIKQHYTRSVTHDSLEILGKRIHNQMGLILDYRV